MEAFDKLKKSVKGEDTKKTVLKPLGGKKEERIGVDITNLKKSTADTGRKKVVIKPLDNG